MELYEMSLEELKQLRKDVEKAIDSFEARQLAEARVKLESHAAEMGVRLEDVLANMSKGKSKPQGAPKFRDPKDPTKTWTGRGRRPEWFNQAIDSGMLEEELKI